MRSVVWLVGSGSAVEIGGGDFSGFDLLSFLFYGLIVGWVLVWVFSMGLILGDYSGF